MGANEKQRRKKFEEWFRSQLGLPKNFNCTPENRSELETLLKGLEEFDRIYPNRKAPQKEQG